MNKIAVEIYKDKKITCEFIPFEDLGYSEESWEDLAKAEQSDLIRSYMKNIYDQDLLIMKWYKEYCPLR
jgi:hypothetical protein